MREPDRDPVVRRVIEELSVLPAVNAEAVRRVVSAAATARVAPAADEVPMLAPPARGLRIGAVIGIAAAAAFAGFAVSTVWRGTPTAKVTVASDASARAVTRALPMRAAANNPAELLPLSQQFVFRSPTAHRVSVVGDFNEWNPTRTPMQRAAGDALWSVTVPIMPGRHVYAYMIDDSLLVLDPRAPQTRDPDLGVDGSVIMVGRP
jgi:hypothetical protein